MTDRKDIPIYIIDDDSEIIDLVKSALELNGYANIETAQTAAEAMNKLKVLPDSSGDKTVQVSDLKVVILDVMLPDMNGFDLCARIKELFSNSLVLMMSGFNIEDLQKQIVECDADDFLTKPFNPLELAARIDLLMSKLTKAAAKKSGQQTLSGYQVPHLGDYIDSYHIIDSLGWGKSSIIYKVVEKETSDIFAIKLLTRYAMDFQEVVERFEHEVYVMSKVKHPNVIKSHKMGNYEGCPYILMDYIAGINLEEFIVTKGKPSLETFLSVAIESASALSAIHEAGLIHRDIKLKNIMIEFKDNRVKLTDFGIAQKIDEDPGFTRDGYIVGTPIYMAPEIFKGYPTNVKSDIYSYGVTMYQFLSGTPPFVAENNNDLYKEHKEKQPESLQRQRPEIPEKLDSLIAKECLAKKPEDRPESMREVLEKLKDIKHSIC